MLYQSDVNLVIQKVKKLYDLFEEDAGLVYHKWSHSEQVMGAAKMIAAREGISENGCRLLETAVAIHDVGNLIRREGHERIGAHYAQKTLSKEYATDEVDIIKNLILVTAMPHKPQNRLEKIMCDADMSLMGYERFIETIDGYRVELGIDDMKQWYVNQVSFLKNHSWFTDGAKALYDVGKKKNLRALEQLIK